LSLTTALPSIIRNHGATVGSTMNVIAFRGRTFRLPNVVAFVAGRLSDSSQTYHSIHGRALSTFLM
jgi:hypothetical protein